MKKMTKKETLRSFLMIVFGSMIFALGYDMFLDPNGISCGGVTGIAMLIVYTTKIPWLTVGILTAAINLPLFFVGYKKIGKHFFFGSLLGMLISSLCYDLFLFTAVRGIDPLLAAIFGAVMVGAGLGVVFLAGASTGGADIVARLLKLKWRNIPIGKIILFMDMITAIATGIVYRDIANTLYSAIALYLISVVLDYVVYSTDFAKVAMIISDKYEEIASAIDSQLCRGITLLNGQGFYRREDKYILISAVKQQQLAQLKEIVTDIDPDAFIILQDARQVLGDGFKRYDRYEL